MVMATSYCGSYRLYFSGRQISRDETPMAMVLRTGNAVRGVEGVVERAKTLKVGSGMQPDTQMGPLISGRQMDRVLDYIQWGLSEGARLLTGGERDTEGASDG